MHKEVAIVLTVFFLPALMVMGVVNEGSIARNEIIDLYLDYSPKLDVSEHDKVLQDQARELLRTTANRYFFTPGGLSCNGYEYFYRTRYLIHTLLKSSCALPLTDGVLIRADNRATSLPVCGLDRAEDAWIALQRVIELNNNLLADSVNGCADGSEALELAKMSARKGNYDAMVDFWTTAWRRSSSCICN